MKRPLPAHVRKAVAADRDRIVTVRQRKRRVSVTVEAGGEYLEANLTPSAALRLAQRLIRVADEVLPEQQC